MGLSPLTPLSALPDLNNPEDFNADALTFFGGFPGFVTELQSFTNMDGVTIGGSTPADGTFDTLTAANLVGMVAPFAMTTAPTGWLECDGSAVSRTTYAALFSAIGTTYGVGDGSTTFNLPDLRGEFVRGWDNSRGLDAGRVFGSGQLDAFQGHFHQIGDETAGGFRTYEQKVGGFAFGGGFETTVIRSPISDGVNGVPRTSSETRPRNVALMYCVKT